MALDVEAWGFETNEAGGLMIGGASAEALAREHGTPLQVIDQATLGRNARRFRAAFENAYPGRVDVHFAMKCNNTPGVVAAVLREGLWPEVGTAYEWTLARRCGVPAGNIVVNGPCKGDLLGTAIAEGVGLVVVDGLPELVLVEEMALRGGSEVRVLLRVNPDCVPRGMNRASATGSRRSSVFGFDLVSGELTEAFTRLARSPQLRYTGLHCHVGTGIRRAEDYERPLELMVEWAARAREHKLETEVLDVGGGFGVPTSRELDTREFLAYQAVGWLPRAPNPDSFPPIEAFARIVSRTIVRSCGEHGLDVPRLVVEPGRAVVSGAGVLLLTVHSLKERDGVGTWAITDGGAGTVAFPLYYEYHEIFLSRDVRAARRRPYSVIGPACFSADWVYRRKRLPELRPGDVLAVCDTGAYFTVQESNFGFPRPPVVSVLDGEARLLRRRETFEDMTARDVGWEVCHAV